MNRKPIAAVSLKMYFSLDRTWEYCRVLADAGKTNQAIASGAVRTAIFPSFLAVPKAAEILAATPTAIGVQNIGELRQGPRTGEVSIVDARDMGCQLVELGHAERITIYGETAEMTAQKAALTLAEGMIPLICIGEPDRLSPSETANLCYEQAMSATGGGTEQEVWFGYEPYWAIGAPEPAPSDYVAEVCNQLREKFQGALPNNAILYGGSAGPGLAQQLGRSVDGLFLGRFAHDPENFLQVVDELASV